jgi:hypothetical protein
MSSIFKQRSPAQGDQSSGSLPADVDVGFNPMDIRNRLLEAIDQSEVRLSMAQADMTGFDLWRRHIDYPKVVVVLSNLTAKQVNTVEQAYEAHEGRTLWEDIGGGGESHHRSDLTYDQLNRIRALLGGTRASSPDTAGEAKTHGLEADAAELHELLYGDLNEPDVERVMTILRRSAKDNVLLATTYERLYVTNFSTDLVKLPLAVQMRARMLVAGQTVAADSFQVGVTRYRIAALNARIDQITKDADSRGLLGEASSLGLLGAAGLIPSYAVDKLRKQRKELVEDLESRLERTGAEARASAAAQGLDPGAADAAARSRVATVLGDVNAAAADIGGRDEAVIRAIAAADPGAKAAARLRRLEEEGKLDAAAVTAALRALRVEAGEEANRQHPDGDAVAIAVEERTLADRYFARLKATWDAGAVGKGPRFDELMGLGSATEATLNQALARGSGRTDNVTELVLALSGNRKDLETVKRVLRDKSAADIEGLKLEYKMRTLGRSLDYDLFGDAPVKAGEYEPVFPGFGPPTSPGKATGTDRLILEDYLQRPSQEGGLDEVTYLADRAEREYQYTIDNRGATGWWRDKWGNEARSLLDETIRDVREWHIQYLKLVGWTWPGTMTSPERAHSPEAHELLHKIRLARATIRGDRAAYEKATAELRATFELVASLVLQAALTAVLGPVAELAILGEVTEEAAVLVRVAAFARDTSVGVASTIGANAIVYGSDYSVEMLKRDLAMGYTGALGGKVAEKLVGPVAAGLAERLGTKCPQEIIALAGTVGSMEASAAAEGESLTDDLNLQGVMKNHLMGKAAHGITKIASKGFRPGAAPRPETVGEPLGEGAPVPEPAKDLPEPAKDLPEPAEDLPEPQEGTISEPATPDLGEGAPASGLDEPAGTGGGGRRRARPEGRPGDRLGGRGAGRGRARRPKSPRTGGGKPGRGGGRKAKGTTSRRGGGGSPHTLGPEVTGLRTRLAEYGRRPGRSRQAKGMRSWLDDIAKRGNEEAIRDAIDSIEDMLANERMPTRSGGIEVDMGDPHIREVFEEAMAAPGLEGNREWDAYRELVYDRYTTKGSVEIGRGRSDDRGNFAKTNEMRARFLAGTGGGGGPAAAAQMMHDHLTGAVRRSGSEAGAVAAGDAVWIDRYSGRRLRGPGPDAALWPADPVWGVWRVDHIVEIQHGGLDDASNYVAAPQRMHSVKSRAMNKFGRAMRAAD